MAFSVNYNMLLQTLTLLLCINVTLIHCCGKQPPPPNFGVPVYKPQPEEDNRTIEKASRILTREERSVPDTWNKHQRRTMEPPNPSLHRIIQDIISNEKLKRNSEQDHNNVDKDNSQFIIQNQNLNAKRFRRSKSSIESSKISAESDEAVLPPESDQREAGAAGSGFNTAAAVTGFALAAIMLLGVSCFIR